MLSVNPPFPSLKLLLLKPKMVSRGSQHSAMMCLRMLSTVLRLSQIGRLWEILFRASERHKSQNVPVFALILISTWCAIWMGTCIPVTIVLLVRLPVSAREYSLLPYSLFLQPPSQIAVVADRVRRLSLNSSKAPRFSR